jgi:hypothetical protein
MTRPIAFAPSSSPLNSSSDTSLLCSFPSLDTLYTYLYISPIFPSLRQALNMPLKRKASFTALPTSPSVPAPSEWGMVIDGNTHLHSRTRKRFRDDRPSDEVIYRKYLISTSVRSPLIASPFKLAHNSQRTHYDGFSPLKSSKRLYSPLLWT